ncbi:MAG TPA: hypothetical protein VMT24_14180, partial [Aggregatilineaceae bacterium]|nr:hypothetical protein [Aggregatilineaceae bacterium]
SSAAAGVERCVREGDALMVDSPHGAGIRWDGPALVDGRLWPAGDADIVWLPQGRHAIRPAKERIAMRLLDLTGDLISASGLASGLEFTYSSSGRALASLDKKPGKMRVDDQPAQFPMLESPGRVILRLPGGRHRVHVETQ